MTPLDAMRSALDFIEMEGWTEEHDATLLGLKHAIVELESAEPVAWQCKSKTRIATEYVYDKQSAKNAERLWTVTPLFTLPAQSRDSIIEECAAVCESQYEHYDGSKHPCFVDADECAAAIRALKGK